jgi:Raf kinase inhibitor-like YbhB/YbcL family protein
MPLTTLAKLLAEQSAAKKSVLKLLGLAALSGGWLLCFLATPGDVIFGQATGGAAPFQIASGAFSHGEIIPKKFTCDGPDVSPPLDWKNAPPATQSLALIMDDPDAPVGTWVHWVIYSLPANIKELPEGVEKQEQLANGALQGQNDFRRMGYGGPCPPPGKPHRYFFKLYALDAKLVLRAGASKADVESAMKGHILGQVELMGRYGR